MLSDSGHNFLLAGVRVTSSADMVPECFAFLQFQGGHGSESVLWENDRFTYLRQHTIVFP